jgi:hypothetical protein
LIADWSQAFISQAPLLKAIEAEPPRAAHKPLRSLFHRSSGRMLNSRRLRRDRKRGIGDLLAAVFVGLIGYLLGTLDTRRASIWLHGYMMMAAHLAAVRMESQSLRQRGKRPSMPAHRKRLVGRSYWFCPIALAATGFSPQHSCVGIGSFVTPTPG